nr:hypothetical protein Iba_chr08eCG2580 [Ipomoea batatas]
MCHLMEVLCKGLLWSYLLTLFLRQLKISGHFVLVRKVLVFQLGNLFITRDAYFIG